MSTSWLCKGIIIWRKVWNSPSQKVFLVLSGFIAVASNFSSLIFISLIFFLINIWSWHNILPLFPLSPPFPKSCFFYFFFNACLILERKTDSDSVPLHLHSIKNTFPMLSAVITQRLHFPRWSLSGAFSGSLGISRFPPCIAHHALPVAWFFFFLASVPLTLKSKTSFFSLSMLCLYLFLYYSLLDLPLFLKVKQL